MNRDGSLSELGHGAKTNCMLVDRCTGVRKICGKILRLSLHQVIQLSVTITEDGIRLSEWLGAQHRESQKDSCMQGGKSFNCHPLL